MGNRNGGGAPTMIRRRQSDFKMSFNLALRSLLTTCSKEASELLFVEAFNQWRYGSYSGHYHFAWEYRGATPSNNAAKMIALCSSVVPLSSSKHFSINPFITALVGTALDTVGQLVEEQCLDHFFSDKTNVIDAVHNLSTAKKAEIQYLRNLLERVGNEPAEGQNRLIQAQVELHKNKNTEKSWA
ncbi:hypothetical protein Gogos_010557 [Gossypium gossypioides]|uniref:Uncharacterized protein n=1 Tax=Gossypium gossypioides TaxID=34282 RepID=A0A7J9BLJ9_GOSGO|nr:hypothetical protein [Gossypium gossypioides]